MNNIPKKYFKKKILPAVTLESKEDALKIAEALLEGGLNVMEIAFRTKVAADSIKEIRDKVGEMIIGAGTLLTPGQVYEAKKAGAQFGVAPGLNESVLKEAKKINFPFIPGVITPSDVEQALQLECNILKLFPVEYKGGAKLLKALLGPYKHTDVAFIPMGGINLDNMEKYLAYQEVLAVGGSWLTPRELIRKQDFHKISNNAKVSLRISQRFC
jgi:2-dehydro-3-deoxyphosphogluconate aldolase/(4S)-4-hydroxy-2-oxoglutarate aldolase